MTPPLLHPSGQHRESKLLELNLQLICMKMDLFVQFAPISFTLYYYKLL